MPARMLVGSLCDNNPDSQSLSHKRYNHHRPRYSRTRYAPACEEKRMEDPLPSVLAPSLNHRSMYVIAHASKANGLKFASQRTSTSLVKLSLVSGYTGSRQEPAILPNAISLLEFMITTNKRNTLTRRPPHGEKALPSRPRRHRSQTPPLSGERCSACCALRAGRSHAVLTITISQPWSAVAFTSGNLDVEASTATVVIFVAETVLYTALAAMFAIFGIRLLRNKRKHAAHQHRRP